jgi:hypothetical protein
MAFDIEWWKFTKATLVMAEQVLLNISGYSMYVQVTARRS